MKKGPYYEIIDLHNEMKEYKKLCRGKSKKYKYYSDWKEYIISCIDKFSNSKDIENFKHYCINAVRVGKKIPDLYINFIILFVTIYIDRCVVNLNLYVWLTILLFSFIMVILGSDSYNKENCFYNDIIEIINDYEK